MSNTREYRIKLEDFEGNSVEPDNQDITGLWQFLVEPTIGAPMILVKALEDESYRTKVTTNVRTFTVDENDVMRVKTDNHVYVLSVAEGGE